MLQNILKVAQGGRKGCGGLLAPRQSRQRPRLPASLAAEHPESCAGRRDRLWRLAGAAKIKAKASLGGVARRKMLPLEYGRRERCAGRQERLWRLVGAAKLRKWPRSMALLAAEYAESCSGRHDRLWRLAGAAKIKERALVGRLHAAKHFESCAGRQGLWRLAGAAK